MRSESEGDAALSSRHEFYQSELEKAVRQGYETSVIGKTVFEESVLHLTDAIRLLSNIRLKWTWLNFGVIVIVIIIT